jgi:hypothetical protein
MTIVLDGHMIEIVPSDLDGDGVVGGIERIQQSREQGVQNVVQPTELGDTLKELNKDNITMEAGMTDIDFRADIHPFEMASVNAFDMLIAINVLGQKLLPVPRKAKRNSVSKNGRGRDDIVNIVAGKREHERDVGGGFANKFKGFMGMGEQQ